MNAVFTGGLVAVLLLPPLATAQTPSSQNIYVLKATARQTTITGPLTLTFREPFMEGEKRKVRETVITVPPTDVMESLTTQVRTHAGSAFSYRRSNELLFVLDVRGRNIPATTTHPLILALSSGTEVTIPSSAVHDAATMWLRANLWSVGTGQAAAPPGSGSKSQGSAPAVDILDTGGVDFGPWIRRFLAHVRRNWLIPEASREQVGHVRAKFNVHKDGRITDIALIEASSDEALNTSVLTALRESNPTLPLPTEYRSPHATSFVTFYFNETPR